MIDPQIEEAKKNVNDAYEKVIDFLDDKMKPDQYQMTLRDQFAMAALPVLISTASGLPTPALLAKGAYAVADAMIEERKPK